MKSKRQFPDASSYVDRHGKRRWRYRKNGRAVELGTEYGSDDFVRRYGAAVNGIRKPIGFNRTVPFSISDLIVSFYTSPKWRNLANSTKRAYRGQLEELRMAHGDKPVDRLERRHVSAILAAKADTPSAANNLRKRIIRLLDHAVELDWIKINPAKATESYKVASGGFHSWDEGEISQFLETYPLGTLAHLAVTIMLYTGASRVDAVKLGAWNIKHTSKGLRVTYRRQKTIKTNGMLVNIPMHPALTEALADLPADRPFLATAYGKPRTAEGLGNAMREWCDKANLPACTSHGLRKACARRLAEAGCSAHHIMSVTGHKTLSEVQRYTEATDRAGLADAAFDMLISGPNQKQNMVNLPTRFAKRNPKLLKEKE